MGQPRPLSAETLLFQSTVPGFDEELIYRGIMFAFIGLALGIQTRIGEWWVVLFTSVLFGLAHGVDWNGYTFTLQFGMVLATGTIGFWLAFVRLYTGSLLPCILLHNVYNVLFSVFAAR